MDEGYDSSTLPAEKFFWGDVVTDEGQQHQARMWFLLAIETYKPARGFCRPNDVIRRLRDDVLPIFSEALARWLELNRDVHRWRTGIPWRDERDNPIFSDLWSGIEKWARQYNLTFQNRPAEWILAAADANLGLWMIDDFHPRGGEADLQWRDLDAFETGRREIKGEWLNVFYNPESMRAEDAHADLERQIQAVQARAVEFGARSTSGLVKAKASRRFYDEKGEVLKIPLSVEWFVRKQICGQRFDSIARGLPPSRKDPVAAVQAACREFANLIELTPRRDKPGPKGKHSQLGK
jgi:hypothetical protein